MERVFVGADEDANSPRVAGCEQLTTCMDQVFGDVLFRNVSGDPALDEFVTVAELVPLGEVRRLAAS